MRSEVALSIIIPSIGRIESVRSLLVSIQAQAFELPYETLVVANLPDLRLRSTVESFGPRFHYFETGKRSANIARNRGLKAAQGEIVLFLDDDCVLRDPMFLKKHWLRHREYPSVFGIGGRYGLRSGASRVERAYHWIADHWLSKSILYDNLTTNLIGGNCSFKRNVAPSALQFDESIRFGGAETELCARLIHTGFKLALFDELVAEHQSNISHRQFAEKAFLQGYSAGRREKASLKSNTVYWRSTLSLEENWYLRGAEPEFDLCSLFDFYDRCFEHGRIAGRRADDSRAPHVRFTTTDYVFSLIPKFSPSWIESGLFDAYVTLERVLNATGATRRRGRHDV